DQQRAEDGRHACSPGPRPPGRAVGCPTAGEPGGPARREAAAPPPPGASVTVVFFLHPHIHDPGIQHEPLSTSFGASAPFTCAVSRTSCPAPPPTAGSAWHQPSYDQYPWQAHRRAGSSHHLTPSPSEVLPDATLACHR